LQRLSAIDALSGRRHPARPADLRSSRVERPSRRRLRLGDSGIRGAIRRRTLHGALWTRQRHASSPLTRPTNKSAGMGRRPFAQPSSNSLQNRIRTMNLRLLTLMLLASTALSSGAFAQTATPAAGANPPAAPADANPLTPAAPQKPAGHGSRAQYGLTAAPTDFGTAEITGGGAGGAEGGGGYNPLDGVTGQDV